MWLPLLTSDASSSIWKFGSDCTGPSQNKHLKANILMSNMMLVSPRFGIDAVWWTASEGEVWKLQTCFSLRSRNCGRKLYISAVYTCIKNPESFSHSGFSLKVARQLPLNTPKTRIEKPTSAAWFFWNSAEISLVYCQCKRSLQSRRYYSGFWSRGTWPSAESPDRGPRRNAHYTCTVKGREKSRMRTTYQNTSMRFGFFRACAFRAKNPECYGFFWQCKRYNKKPRFFGFWFLPM